MAVLTFKQSVYHRLRFDRGLKQREAADYMGMSHQAASAIEARIIERFERAGELPPLKPGRGLVRVGCVSLSAWA